MPALTAVIPTLRRPEALREALDHLERQTAAAGAFEVVVVSDAGDEDPGAAGAALGARPFAARHLVAPRPGVGAARNAGWRDARAPLVLFLGDDILAAPELVAEHLAWHERHPATDVGVLGHVRWADRYPRTALMRLLDRGIQFDYAAIDGEEAGWGRFYTANVSVKCALLAEVGGFDEDFPFPYEDLELAHRLHHRAGLRLLYAPAARAEHLHEPTLAEWRAKMPVLARAERAFVAKHPDVAPYFHDRFARAVAEGRPRGRGARLAGLVPPGVPWLGPRVEASAQARIGDELARAFLAAWEAEGQASGGGSRPGGPK